MINTSLEILILESLVDADDGDRVRPLPLFTKLSLITLEFDQQE